MQDFTILTARQKKILSLLLRTSTPISMEELKRVLQKSERTIRYDIAILKKICLFNSIEIRYTTKKGYYIPLSQKKLCSEFMINFEEDQNNSILQESDEQRFHNIFLFLLQQKKGVSSEKIAEKFYISKSTVFRIMNKLEAFYSNKIEVSVSKTYGYMLQGNELEIRKIAMKLIASCFSGSYTTEDWFIVLPKILKSKVSLQTISKISDSIKKINAKYNIWISNTAFLNILSYCIVQDIRRTIVYKKNEELIVFNSENDNYAWDLMRELTFHKKQQVEQEITMLCEILNLNEVKVREKGLEQVDFNEVLSTILKVIEEDNKNNKYDIDSLYKDLSAHLRNFFCVSVDEREKNDFLIQQVKEQYKEFYELATKCGSIIEQLTKMPFQETEICYVAVYLYKNCNHDKAIKKNVYIVCATGKGLSHLLTIRIKNLISNINVLGQISPYQLSKPQYLNKADFVISTIPIQNSKVPVLKISSILTKDDIQKIQEFIQYGKMVDETSLSQKNESSAADNRDLFDLEEYTYLGNRNNLADSATIISKLILTLLDYTSKFSDEHKMSRDAILGMIIHMSMALPRWLKDNGDKEESEDSIKEYKRIKEEYPDIYLIMEHFFELVDNSLQIAISNSEKVAFFLYILEEM